VSKIGKKLHSFLERVLPRPIYRALRALERFVVEILLQKILGTLALVLVYVFVIGPTSIVMRLFFRRSLRKPTVAAGSDWVTAEHYQPDLERSYFQS
jgi:hypothetical protein